MALAGHASRSARACFGRWDEKSVPLDFLDLHAMLRLDWFGPSGHKAWPGKAWQGKGANGSIQFFLPTLLSGDQIVNDTVTRLQASKVASDSAEHSTGFEAGQAWAKNRASVPELKAIEGLHGRLDSYGNWQDWFDNAGGSAYSSAEHLQGVISPDGEIDREEARDFWEGEDLDVDNLSASFVRGFAEGAIGVWNAVSSQL